MSLLLPSNTPPPWTRALSIASAVVLFLVALYGPSLSHFFLRDDYYWLDYAALIQDQPLQIFHDHFDFYMPVVHLTWAAIYAGWGLDPVAYQVTRLLLLAGNALLLIRLLRTMNIRLTIALLCGMLLVANGAAGESYLWLSCWTHLLCGIGILAALNLLQRYRLQEDRRTLVLLWLAVLFTLLVKETGVALLLLLPIAWGLFSSLSGKKPLERRTLFALMPLLLVVGYAVFMVLHHAEKPAMQEARYGPGTHALINLVANFPKVFFVEHGFLTRPLTAGIWGAEILVVWLLCRNHRAAAGQILYFLALIASAFGLFCLWKGNDPWAGEMESRYFFLPTIAHVFFQGWLIEQGMQGLEARLLKPSLQKLAQGAAILCLALLVVANALVVRGLEQRDFAAHSKSMRRVFDISLAAVGRAANPMLTENVESVRISLRDVPVEFHFLAPLMRLEKRNQLPSGNFPRTIASEISGSEDHLDDPERAWTLRLMPKPEKITSNK